MPTGRCWRAAATAVAKARNEASLNSLSPKAPAVARRPSWYCDCPRRRASWRYRSNLTGGKATRTPSRNIANVRGGRTRRSQPQRHQRLVVQPPLVPHGVGLHAVGDESAAFVAPAGGAILVGFLCDGAEPQADEAFVARPIDAGLDQLSADAAAAVRFADVDAPDGADVRELRLRWGVDAGHAGQTGFRAGVGDEDGGGCGHADG